MSKIEKAISEIEQCNSMAHNDQWMNKIHPLVKFVLTLMYIIITLSFHKYDIFGCFSMFLYPCLLFMLTDLSFWHCLRRIWGIFPVIIIMGIGNLWFEQNVIMLGGVGIPAGCLAMLTLCMKTVFCVLASYLLIVTTPMEQICHALRMLRIPKIIVMQIQLSYRYIPVVLAEVQHMIQAYALRAPGQNGISIKAWGSFVGQLILRCFERAVQVYESMMVRGFDGEYAYAVSNVALCFWHIFYFVIWIVIFMALRIFPVCILLGNFVERIL